MRYRYVVLGRKNYLFAGSDAGGERAAAIYSLLGTAKLNGLDPELYSATCAGEERRSPGQPPTGTPSLARCRSSTNPTRKSLSVHEETLRGHLNLT